VTDAMPSALGSALAVTVAHDRQSPLDWRDKAVQPAWYGRTITDVVATSPDLDSLSTPMMTLDRKAMDENLAAMRDWCELAGVSLAPHGKTTMAPELWREQIDAGAWAITVANEPQLRVARGVGVRRVIVANMLLRPEALAWLSAELDADDGFEFYCWVDSVEAVGLMDAALRSAGARRRVPVLIEMGCAHARTGARSHSEAVKVADAVVAASTLALAGVSGFEASVAHAADEAGIAAVDEFLTRMVDLHRALVGRYEIDEVLLSAGGSAYFDRVAAILGPECRRNAGIPTRIVLRSGAYVVHDDGFYRGVTPHTRGTGPAFRSAMHVWARVISMPESGIAYLDAGKRDLPFDEGLPELQILRRRDASGGVSILQIVGHELIATNDQHAHVRLPNDSPLRVGDVVRLGLSHPCTAFDKWSLIPVIDNASADTPVVVDLVRTYF
jgi:D-serine deaminase-like pyridoxal phosphate-dependent protein